MNLSGASPKPASSSNLLGFQESLGRDLACQDLLLVLPCRNSKHVGSRAQCPAAGMQPSLWGHLVPTLSFHPSQSHSCVLLALPTTLLRVASESPEVAKSRNMSMGERVGRRADLHILPSVGSVLSASFNHPRIGLIPSAAEARDLTCPSPLLRKKGRKDDVSRWPLRDDKNLTYARSRSECLHILIQLIFTKSSCTITVSILEMRKQRGQATCLRSHSM